MSIILIRIIILFCISPVSCLSAAEIRNHSAVNKVALLAIPARGDFTVDQADAVWHVMRDTMTNTAGFDVMENRLTNAVPQCSLKPYDKDCFISTGKALKVDTLITGNVVHYNKLYYLSFLRINSSTGKVENMADDECPEKNLIDFSKQISQRLTQKFFFLEPNPVPDWKNPTEVNDFFKLVLQAPDKDTWQKPQLVIDTLPIKEGSIIAEIGAGTGYFTSWLSRKVGPKGRVYATDIEQEMLDHIEQKIKTEALHNVKTVLASKNVPNLPKNSVDLIFMCDVFTDIYSIPHKIEYLRKLKEALKPNGQIVVIDYQVPININGAVTSADYAIPTTEQGGIDTQPKLSILLTMNHFKGSAVRAGIPFTFRIPKEKAIDTMIKAGFTSHTDHAILPYQYFLVFIKTD
jgi:ubiquinone/menaquinone biosynthesis C-methylase UbiE